jgi:hypothetical protein
MRWFAGGVAILAVAVASGITLAGDSSGKGGTILMALVDDPKVDCLRTRVVRAHRSSLKPIAQPMVEVAGAFEQPVYSPDGKTVALGGDTGTLIVVDPHRLRLKATVRVAPPGDNVRVAGWSTPTRVVATSMTGEGGRPYVTRVAVIDLNRATMIEGVRLPDADVGGDPTQAGRIGLLVVSRRRIGAPRILVVDAGGGIRAVPLLRLRAGRGTNGAGRSPAYVVDPRGERALVLSVGEPAAIVDLRTLRIRYERVAIPLRRISAPHPANVSPPTDRLRQGAWLGGGLIAISGSDGYASTRFRPPSWELDSFTPAGLMILDTRTWRRRMLDPRPSSFEWLRGRLVAYGRTYSTLAPRTSDETLIAFDRTGHRAYSIQGDRDTYWQAFDDRIFLYSPRWRGTRSATHETEGYSAGSQLGAC